MNVLHMLVNFILTLFKQSVKISLLKQSQEITLSGNLPAAVLYVIERHFR